MLKQAQPALKKPPRREPESSELDPAKLSVALRDLALRAHQLVRAADGRGSDLDVEYPERDLVEVHAQILRLQRHLGSHGTGDLATYVAALRARVEECLA